MKPYYNWKILSSQPWVKTAKIHPTHPIKNSEQTGWISPTGSICQQTFDGRYAYLYYYEYDLKEPITIAIQRKKGDLHLLYPLQNEGMDLCFCQESGDIPLEIHQEGSYIYSPRGHYKLDVAAGKHILIGFIIDAGLIRKPASRAYEFIVPLVEAKRSKAKEPLYSASFAIGPLTRRALDNIYGLLNPKELTNEFELLRLVIYLIQLSRLKLLLVEEREQMQEPDRLILHARSLLKASIKTFGAKVLLSDIAESLEVSLDKLSLIHKQYYQCNLQQYRNDLLLKQVIRAIKTYDRMIEAALYCGFAGIPEMSRFVKKQTGHPPSYFR